MKTTFNQSTVRNHQANPEDLKEHTSLFVDLKVRHHLYTSLNFQLI